MGDLLTWVLSRQQTAKQRSLARETLRAGNPDLKGKEVLALALYQTTSDGPKNIGKQLGIPQDRIRDMIRGLWLPTKPHSSTHRKICGKASQLVTKWNALLRRVRKPLPPKRATASERYYANHEANKAYQRERQLKRYHEKLKNDPEYKANAKEYMRAWNRKNRAKKAANNKAWKDANPERYRQIVKASRRKQDKKPYARMAHNLRARLRELVREGLAYRVSRAEFIGCSPKQLVDHVTSLFQPDMGWNNYGEWHLDHIKPCASFDLTDRAQVLACFHYTNLQPLWRQANEQKSSWHNGVRYARGKAA